VIALLTFVFYVWLAMCAVAVLAVSAAAGLEVLRRLGLWKP
jgi:hypothetical protein